MFKKLLLATLLVGVGFSAQAQMEPIVLDEAQLDTAVFCRITAEQYARAISDYRRDIPLHLTESPARFDHVDPDIFSSQYGVLYSNYVKIADQVYENDGLSEYDPREIVEYIEESCLQEN